MSFLLDCLPEHLLAATLEYLTAPELGRFRLLSREAYSRVERMQDITLTVNDSRAVELVAAPALLRKLAPSIKGLRFDPNLYVVDWYSQLYDDEPDAVDEDRRFTFDYMQLTVLLMALQSAGVTLERLQPDCTDKRISLMVPVTFVQVIGLMAPRLKTLQLPQVVGWSHPTDALGDERDEQLTSEERAAATEARVGAFMAALPASLTDLKLHCPPQHGGRVLAKALGHRTALQRLRLLNAGVLPHGGVSLAVHLTGLRSLRLIADGESLSWKVVDPSMLANLTALTGLTTLKLVDYQIPIATLCTLLCSSALTALQRLQCERVVSLAQSFTAQLEQLKAEATTSPPCDPAEGSLLPGAGHDTASGVAETAAVADLSLTEVNMAVTSSAGANIATTVPRCGQHLRLVRLRVDCLIETDLTEIMTLLRSVPRLHLTCCQQPYLARSLSALTGTTELQLWGAARLSDAQLISLSRQLFNVRHLVLTTPDALTSTSWAALSRVGLPMLTILRVCGCRALTVADCVALANKPLLQRLELVGCKLLMGAEAQAEVLALQRPPLTIVFIDP